MCLLSRGASCSVWKKSTAMEGRTQRPYRRSALLGLFIRLVVSSQLFPRVFRVTQKALTTFLRPFEQEIRNERQNSK